MPQSYYIVPAPEGGIGGIPGHELPTPPVYPGQGLPGAPGYPSQGLPVYPSHGRPPGWDGPPWGPHPGHGLPYPPVYPGHGLPPAPVYPNHGLPGSGIPWWLLPILIGPAGGVYSGVTESSIPVHPEKPDPTKPGTWILVAVAPGDVRWAWAPTKAEDDEGGVATPKA